MSTLQQYEAVIQKCKELFLIKTADYGTSWRVLRTISVVDQIYIKAYRIRTVQELGHQKIEDGIDGEFIGIINYAIIGLIQLQLTEDDEEELEIELTGKLYNEYASEAIELMKKRTMIMVKPGGK